MKKCIGPVIGIYPTLIALIGTEVNGTVNWINLAHLGVIGIDQICLSISKTHYTNEGIYANRTLSINLVNESMLVHADYAGLVSGRSTDKSNLFPIFRGTLQGAPMIGESPLTMECEVEEILETATHNVLIVKPVNTYVEENCLSREGQIDSLLVDPVFFDMHMKHYVKKGKVIGKAWSIGENYLVKG